MKSNNSESIFRSAKQSLLATVAVSLLTSVHHAYGAYIYKTPWRHHAALVSVVATAVIAGSLRLFRKRSGTTVGSVALWVFIGVTFLVPFLAFGVFESGYNHAAKDALYFKSVSPHLMRQLFPPPTYEMPNNVFFEVTGVLQVLPGALTGYWLYRFVSERQRLLGGAKSHAKIEGFGAESGRTEACVQSR